MIQDNTDGLIPDLLNFSFRDKGLRHEDSVPNGDEAPEFSRSSDSDEGSVSSSPMAVESQAHTYTVTTQGLQ